MTTATPTCQIHSFEKQHQFDPHFFLKNLLVCFANPRCFLFVEPRCRPTVARNGEVPGVWFEGLNESNLGKVLLEMDSYDYRSIFLLADKI